MNYSWIFFELNKKICFIKTCTNFKMYFIKTNYFSKKTFSIDVYFLKINSFNTLLYWVRYDVYKCIKWHCVVPPSQIYNAIYILMKIETYQCQCYGCGCVQPDIKFVGIFQMISYEILTVKFGAFRVRAVCYNFSYYTAVNIILRENSIKGYFLKYPNE